MTIPPTGFDGSRTVRFLPEESEAPLDPGRTLLEHAAAAGVDIFAPCAGKGRCGKCRVKVLGENRWGDDPDVLSLDEVKRGVRLACRCHPLPGGVVEVDVPGASRPARLNAFLDGRETEGRGPFEPRPPLPGGKHPLGVALDLGASTLSGVLLDLVEGRVLARAGCDNPQMQVGEDILSRIIHAERAPGGLFRLQELLLQGVDGLVATLLAPEGRSSGDVREVVAAGNTVLSHLLHGIDPASIRTPPYNPPTLEFPDRLGSLLGSSQARGARWRTLPALGGFVGGDVVAGLIACGLPRMVEPSLYIDLGSSGDVVLGSRDSVIACFSSPGPAFEGGEVGCGVRPVPGAIDSVRIEGPGGACEWTTLGNSRPLGICGSGVLDLVSELSRVGLLDRSGRLVGQPGGRLREKDGGLAFVIAEGNQTATGEAILLSDAELRRIMRAKASLCAAAETLLAAVGLPREAVRKLFIAGGFGRFLDVRSAARLGLFPPYDLKRFIPLGNASLAGGLALLRAPSRWAEAASLVNAATYHDLSSDRSFMDRFQSAQSIPNARPEAYLRVLAQEGLGE